MRQELKLNNLRFIFISILTSSFQSLMKLMNYDMAIEFVNLNYRFFENFLINHSNIWYHFCKP